jgi:hypothetical protein
VVTAARQALETGDVNLVLPFVPEQGEPEVRAVFDTVSGVRGLGDAAGDVADRLFFETVVRVHRAGEGAPYTGLKPAGLSVGPVIPLAEQAIEARSAQPVADFLAGELHDQLRHRMEEVIALAAAKDRSMADARAYVQAMLGFEVFCHHLFQAMHAPAHGESGDVEQHDSGHTHEDAEKRLQDLSGSRL